METRTCYLAAAEAFADLIARIDTDGWEHRAGLGVWTLRDLVGHAVSAGLGELLDAIDHPATASGVTTPEGYYALARTVDPAVYAAAVAAGTERARGDGAALGAQPAASVRELVAAVGTTLAGTDPATVIRTPAGGMAVDAWLPTRTFELVVHGLDIAASTGVPANLPDPVLAEAAVLAVRIAAAVGDGAVALRALTGRGSLPAGFTVV